MAPKQKTGEQFLHERDQNLHRSRETEDTVSYLRENGEKIPNEPSEKIKHYLAFLADEQMANDGLLTGNKESIERQIESLIIRPDDVPESYFDLQKRIDRERGKGDVEYDATERGRMIESIRADQRASLRRWTKYLTDPTNRDTYPDWFKKYAFEGMLKLGKLQQKEDGTAEFTKRSRGTTAPFVDVNPEALGYVLDAIKFYHTEEDEPVRANLRQNLAPTDGDDMALDKIGSVGNFAKLYAKALMEKSPISAELREITAGDWVKYDQIEGDYTADYEVDDEGNYVAGKPVDDPSANQLAESLQGMGTGWCTAGYSTAAEQLSKGDFYVFYTHDEDGVSRIPRIAVRMSNGRVEEVRGIQHDQNLEQNMMDIAMEKVATLPGGEEYEEKAANMKWLTALDESIQAGGNLSAEDLYRLRYAHIEGFGWDDDPRIAKLIDGRDEDEDITMILEQCNQREVVPRLVEKYPGTVVRYMEKIDPQVIDQKQIADGLLKAYDDYMILAENIDKFDIANVDVEALVAKLSRGGSQDQYDVTAKNMDLFLKNMDANKLQNMLLAGYWPELIEHLDGFPLHSIQNDHLLIQYMSRINRHGTDEMNQSILRNLDKIDYYMIDIDDTMKSLYSMARPGPNRLRRDEGSVTIPPEIVALLEQIKAGMERARAAQIEEQSRPK